MRKIQTKQLLLLILGDTRKAGRLIAISTLMLAGALALLLQPSGGPALPVAYAAGHDHDKDDGSLDRELAAVLANAGFTGKIEQTFHERLEQSLGRPINPKLANLGRLLWFDKIHALHHDNTCGGCHSPSNGFGDSQPMAIGVQNNNLVGPDRAGPRNQRRTPLMINTALYPGMMWNARFSSLSGDPFDNSQGFLFPFPDDTRFSFAQDVIHNVTVLLQAQAHIPPTEVIEVAGFDGACPNGNVIPDIGEIPSQAFCVFDDGGVGDVVRGETLPPPNSTGARNEPVRQVVLSLLNTNANYRQLFGNLFPEVKAGAPIDFFMFGKAISEFEFTMVLANAPIDQFARGDHDAMTGQEKRGALLFFGKARCVQCHAVSGKTSGIAGAGFANEMFSDFLQHDIGVPQLTPGFGVGKGNVIFDGPGANEDFGREEFTGNSADRYLFRTSPLRNLAVSPGFFHNGSFIKIEDAIRHHLDARNSDLNYDPAKAGVPADLRVVGPSAPVLAKLDPILQTPINLTEGEFNALVAFVKNGLFDQRASPKNLCKLVPAQVPSGLPVLQFEACQALKSKSDN